eukprot:gene21165-28061_t
MWTLLAIPTTSAAHTVPRLKPDSTKAFVPGPGAYEEGNAWLKRSHRYEPPSPKQRICYQKSATAPSIPATSQSFGYEEGAAGELVAQRPVDHVHTELWLRGGGGWGAGCTEACRPCPYSQSFGYEEGAAGELVAQRPVDHVHTELWLQGGGGWGAGCTEACRPCPYSQSFGYEEGAAGELVAQRPVDHVHTGGQSFGYEEGAAGELVAQRPVDHVHTGGQSFGYEEGAAGELVAQRPVDHVHTELWLRGGGGWGAGCTEACRPCPYSQSFGYEEGAAGELVAQRPVDHVHTGEGFDKVGPGSYNITSPSVGNSSKAVAWGKSKARRDAGLPKGSAAPGPGYYNPQPASAPANSPIIVSVNGVQEREVTPGPGQYSVDPGLAAKYTQGPPKEMQFFGATSRRASQIDPTKSLSAPTYFKNPGPGAYEESRRADKALISRGGVFGSTATRFASKSASSQPGPGNYEPLLERHRVNTSNEMSTFTSKTRRFSPTRAPAASIYTSDQSLTAQGIVKGDPARIGPGSYQKAAFGTGGQRHDITTSTTPGPGRYNDSVDVNKVYRPYSVPARNTVFGVQADRFKSTGNFTPGPGHYSTSGDVVKKSFNITFAGHGEA